MRTIYSVAFWLFFCTTCVVMFCLGLVLFLVTLPFDPNGRAQHLFSCFWAQLYFYCNPRWSLRVSHRERIPWKGPAVIVSNHESLGDVLVLFGLYRPFKWVSKASVFKLPFLGWNMSLNRYVPLVRGNPESIAKMFTECEGWLRRGVPVLLFPEGTRSDTGEVKAFKDGAFKLAIKMQVPIIPLALTGTARTLPKHGFVLEKSCHCHVSVMEPLSVAPFGEDYAALRDHVRELIIAEKARVLEGAQQADGKVTPARTSQAEPS
jgi:1-acyl-sn-glycerol-3-phosphate acyltransferase